MLDRDLVGALRSHVGHIVEQARELSAARGTANDLAILSELIEQRPLAGLVADNTGAYVAANGAALELTEYSASELLRMSVWDLTPVPAVRDIDVLWRAFLQQREQSGRYELITSRGRTILAAYVARAHVLPGLHLSLMARLDGAAPSGA